MKYIIQDIFDVFGFIINLIGFGIYGIIIISLILVFVCEILEATILKEKDTTKPKRTIIKITLLLFIASSIFFIPFNRYGVIDTPYEADEILEGYNVKEYHHIYDIPTGGYRNVKPQGQSDYVNVKIKYSIVYEELIIRYLIIILIITFYKIIKKAFSKRGIF